MDDNKPLIIVLSRNYSTGLGVIRSLGAAGYTVDLISSVKKRGSSIIASSSKYVRHSEEVLTRNLQGEDGKELIEVLRRYMDSHQGEMIIFPTDDFTAFVVDSNRELLKERFHIPEIVKPKGATVTAAMDKVFQSKLAKEVGIEIPRQWTIPLQSKINIPEDMVYPCFLKPKESFLGHKEEMAVCQSEEELVGALQNMQTRYNQREVLVQEYLDIEKEYDFSGISIDQQVIIPALVEKIMISQNELGVTMRGKMISNDTMPEIANKLIKMIKKFHYVGMFDGEFNVANGKIYFSEINLRSGGPNYAYYLNGVNLPNILVKEITGQGHSKDEEELKEYGKTFIYEKVAWEDYIHSHMTKEELKKYIAEADYKLIENKDDPKPGKVFKVKIRMSAGKNKLLRR